jgi:hypothetical protein
MNSRRRVNSIVMPHRFGTPSCVMSQNNQPQTQIRDVDRIIEGVRQTFPEAVVDQLKVTHPADDDCIWYFHLPENPKDDIQIESSYGNCPFLIENMRSNDCRRGKSVEQIVSIICEYFRESRESGSFKREA